MMLDSEIELMGPATTVHVRSISWNPGWHVQVSVAGLYTKLSEGRQGEQPIPPSSKVIG
jgi:hypothetical protein